MTDNILETVRDRDILATEDLSASIPMTLSDGEGHFCCLKFF